MFPGKVILEGIPFSLWLIQPIHMPDPQQIVRAFIAHQIDNVPVSRDVACRPFLLAAIPFTIPAEPVSVWLRAPLDQDRRSKTLCVARPGAKIDIVIRGNNFLKRKGLL